MIKVGVKLVVVDFLVLWWMIYLVYLGKILILFFYSLICVEWLSLLIKLG